MINGSAHYKKRKGSLHYIKNAVVSSHKEKNKVSFQQKAWVNTNMRPVCFKSHLFPSQWGGYTKNRATNQISRLVWSNLSNCRKMKDKEYHVVNFATFVSKTLIFSTQKMDEFNFKPAQYCINKIFELTKSCIWAISKWM